jgi:hypothetical protein
MGDYDSAAWTYRMLPGHWDDPGRGRIPLAWQLNPNLSDRMPPVFDFIYDSLTPNDFIIAGDSGAGYVNPTHLLEPRFHSGLPSGMDVWMEHCKRYYAKFDLSVTGFLLNGLLPLTPESVRPYNGVSPAGSGYKSYRRNPELPSLIDGVPYLRHSDDLSADPAQFDETERTILRWTKDRPKPDFHIFRLILAEPSNVLSMVEKLKEKHPEKDFEALDPVTFFRLFKEREMSYRNSSGNSGSKPK